METLGKPLYTIAFSEHGRWRACRQNLSSWDIDYVYEHGWRRHAVGARLCFLRLKDIPAGDRRLPTIARLEGTTLVLSKKGVPTLITCYREATGNLGALRKRPAYSREIQIRQARIETARLRDERPL